MAAESSNVMNRRQAMLAWWGIIPLAAFVAVHLTYGQAVARARATGPHFVVSYLMGGIIGGILVSLVVCWMAYRATRRSQNAGTLAFSAMILLFALSSFRHSRYQQSSTAGTSAPTGQAAPKPFPLFGVSLSSPPDWQELSPDRPDVIRRWISPDSRAGDVRGMIMVQGGKPALPDAAQIAEQIARDWHGHVDADHTSLDGEAAFRIEANSTGADLRPIEGLFTIHDGHVYMIMGGLTQGHTVHEQIEFLRESWRWIPVESPLAHLEFRHEPLLAFGGKVWINFPTAMYTFDATSSETRISLRLPRLGRDLPDMLALAQLGTFARDDTFEAAEVRLSKGTVAQFKLPESFTWHSISAANEAAMTQLVPNPGEGHAHVTMALVALGERQFVLMNFTINAEDPAERTEYTKVAQKIAESVTIAPRARR